MINLIDELPTMEEPFNEPPASIHDSEVEVINLIDELPTMEEPFNQPQVINLIDELPMAEEQFNERPASIHDSEDINLISDDDVEDDDTNDPVNNMNYKN
jgi:hypothetical protein